LAEGIDIMNDPKHVGVSDRLPHGGRLREAARRYGIPQDAWLDLSTGINPHAYPVPAIPLRAWARLPEDDDGLIDVAQVLPAPSPWEPWQTPSGKVPCAGSCPRPPPGSCNY
jgi:cobalamin biosynthetic protein CobC